MTQNSERDADWAFSSLTPDTLLNALESLGWVCDGAFLALNSYENRVYQVGIEDAPPVIAKFYRPGRWQAAQIQEELDFVQELSDADIPVIAPLPAPNTGQTLNTQGQFHIAVYPRRGGYSLEMDNPDQLYRLGQALGRLHLVGQTKAFMARPALSLNEFGTQAVETVLQSDSLPLEMREIYRGVATDLLQLVQQKLQEYGDWKSLRLHGDCHASNIIQRDDVLHLVDFDDARQGPAIQDLWLFLSGDLNEQRLALCELLEGYEQFCEFDRRELHLIEPLRSLRILNYAAWLCRRWQDPAFPKAFPWFSSGRFWDEHILNLREQIASTQEPQALLI